MLVIERLVQALRSAAIYNPEAQVSPACILWPDSDRQWQAIIPRLQGELPELVVLGDYAPEQRTGPAIWLRCLLARALDDAALPNGRPPILYLPGVSRQDLRAVESCPEPLKPLAELQYRGVLWSQINAKDWTLLAFLKSDQGGLGLDVAQDNSTKNAMGLALSHLLDEEVAILHGKRLDSDYFNTLLTRDPVRDLLLWLDGGDAFRNSRGENEWRAFVEITRSQLAFNPEHEGVLAGAASLATHEGPWQAVWERYCEAPTRYPNIPNRIRQCQPPKFDLFTGAEIASGWPQWNEEQELNLQRDLEMVAQLPPPKARQQILALEADHAPRRGLIWTELGESPLAQALASLATLAQVTAQGLAAGGVADLVAGYSHHGWQADWAVIGALAVVARPADVAAVSKAIRAVYVPWAEDSARHLQQIWSPQAHGRHTRGSNVTEKEACLLFVDGLRFDCAKQLAALLQSKGYHVSEKTTWAALPSVTATGKPAVAPLGDGNAVAQEPDPYNFEPLSAYQFKKAIEDNGWKIVKAKDPIPAPIQATSLYATASVVNRVWCEFGDIDHEGHDRGWKLARHLESLLAEIRERVLALFDAGWQSVRVVTDHGWLLLPDGLPKIELPSALAENKWGRCAAIKPGATTQERLYPWYWNPHQYFALADGICCFRNGEEYTHGGVSLQECLTLELTVTRGAGSLLSPVEFTDIAWKGLRCTVAVDGEFGGLALDMRTQPGKPASSIVVSSRPLKENGTASVVVENVELEHSRATLVLLSADGALVAQTEIVIGGESA